MKDINVVTLAGRLAAEPEVKTFPNGGQVTKSPQRAKDSRGGPSLSNSR